MSPEIKEKDYDVRPIVGGHKQYIKVQEQHPGILIKETYLTEYNFYENLFQLKAIQKLQKFRQFVPNYYGGFHLAKDDCLVDSVLDRATIQMENLTN